MQRKSASRRRFLGGLATASLLQAQSNANGNRVTGFDHVALPMQNGDAMIAFYKSLGFAMTENALAVSVYIGQNMINFHRPATWQRESFTLRAPAAKPPCGDLCFVWNGNAAQLKAWLDSANVKTIEGPVARQGGRRKSASSVYVRDPDGNLLEFMIYS